MGNPRRRHHRISTLPAEVVQQVNSLLAKPGTTYQAVTDFLHEQGYQVSHSSVGRYGKDFMSRLERLQVVKEQAQAIISDSGDRPATEMGEAANQLAIQLIMEHLMTVDTLEGEKISEVLKALAQLERSGTGREKLKLDYQQRAKKTATRVEEHLRKKGAGPDTVKFVRAEIRGITAS